MARTIAEIKKEMTDAYISNSIIRDIYGITGDADFDSVFSPVSIESTLFYIMGVQLIDPAAIKLSEKEMEEEPTIASLMDDIK